MPWVEVIRLSIVSAWFASAFLISICIDFWLIICDFISLISGAISVASWHSDPLVARFLAAAVFWDTRLGRPHPPYISTMYHDEAAAIWYPYRYICIDFRQGKGIYIISTPGIYMHRLHPPILESVIHSASFKPVFHSDA